MTGKKEKEEVKDIAGMYLLPVAKSTEIMMPKMDGLEATRTIRQLDREECKTLPIIAMSANAFDEDVKRSIASGMNGHLSKPVNVSLLKETLASILG